jgi:hypothetical protein
MRLRAPAIKIIANPPTMKGQYLFIGVSFLMDDVCSHLAREIEMA